MDMSPATRCRHATRVDWTAATTRPRPHLMRPRHLTAWARGAVGPRAPRVIAYLLAALVFVSEIKKISLATRPR